jgi:hypothetical protein
MSLGLGIGVAAAQPSDICAVPAYLLFGDYNLTSVSAAVRDSRRLDVLVVGTGSSILAGNEAYPARLEQALTKRLPGIAVKVTTVAKTRQTADEMAKGLDKILGDVKPSLVIWQTGTVDAMRGVDPESFRTTLEKGLESLQAKGTDVVLMNMQYSPRTETMIALGSFVDNMRWVSQQRGVPLFDRLAIMRHWSEAGSFDMYATTKDPAMAGKVHECIGRALAALVIEAAHLDSLDNRAAQ